ncbi:MAG: RNA-directed DNA polymerase [Planctomycetes bacterium]|nr:RNA-directed DNA polymerase [Planctomycetota bacterium]
MPLSVEQHARDVARTLVARPFTAPAIEAVLVVECGRPDPRLARLAKALALRFGGLRRPRAREVADYLVRRRRYAETAAACEMQLQDLPRRSMLPLPGAPATWKVPAIVTTTELAAFLRVGAEELAAWCRRWRRSPGRPDPRHEHYHCRWLPRHGAPPRLLEVPKTALKRVQRRILTGILQAIPPHPVAHGFVRGRGVATFTAQHTDRDCVLQLDIEDFFGSIQERRVRAVFVAAGYPVDVAAALARLCTTHTPPRVLAELVSNDRARRLATRLAMTHLPQGAPTSPALANLIAFRCDLRLAGLARRFGGGYTRYADDLLFSGGPEFAADARRCATHAAAILETEGFAVAHRKTRVMRRGVAQRAGGLVLNRHGAVPRASRERLEAILTNCVRHGPASQNRAGVVDFAAHLQGRVAHVAHHHPPHGVRLLRLLAQIDWCR